MSIADLIRPACPFCDGKGGFMDGYYEPEFSGCRCCNPNEDNEAPVTRVWRWQWWLFRFSEWREARRLDKWVDEQVALEGWNSDAPSEPQTPPGAT